MAQPDIFTVPQPEAATSAAFEARWGAVEDIATLQTLSVRLPELSGEVMDVYDRVVEAERNLVAPHLLVSDYAEGTAEADDEVWRMWSGQIGKVLIGADHATDPVRKLTGRREGADHGTAGLTAVLVGEGLGDGILPIGRQTGNATVTPEYPYKSQLLGMMADCRSSSVLSLHGMRPGLVTDALDNSEVHGLIGLGKYEPLPETLAAAEELRRKAAEELGLRVLISNYQPHLVFQNDPAWRPGDSVRDKLNAIKIDEEGQPRRSRLAALGENSTANFVMRNQPEDRAVPVYQFEMSRSIRLTPEDVFTRDRKAQANGVYVGYLLATLAAKTLHEQANRQR